jgi:nitrous oxidase accessory protein NosD
MMLKFLIIGLLVSYTCAFALPEAEGTSSDSLATVLSSRLMGVARRKNDKTIRVQAGQSIQAAIDSAPRGSRIVVDPGNYTEQLLVKTDGITLIGNGVTLTPPDSPIENECTGFAGPNADNTSSQAGFCVAGSGLDLSAFVAEHKRVNAVQTPIRGVTITGFTVSGFSGFNILVIGGESVDVRSNKLLDGPKYGFLTAGSKNTKVLDNEITSTVPGFYFIGLCMDNFSKVKVSKNKISTYYIGLW